MIVDISLVHNSMIQIILTKQSLFCCIMFCLGVVPDY